MRSPSSRAPRSRGGRLRLHRHDTPVIPFGTGTSLEGGVAALRGGVCIDLSGMNEILRVSPEDLDVTVQAGVTRKRLNRAPAGPRPVLPDRSRRRRLVGRHGLDPRQRHQRRTFGTMRENVLGLTVVMADGRIIKTGGRARKSAAGYDLTRLFVGAEGTLGVITEVTLRLYRHSGSRFRRCLRVSDHQGRGRYRHHGHPVRHPCCPDRAA